jgi:hypothetical protein
MIASPASHGISLLTMTENSVLPRVSERLRDDAYFCFHFLIKDL